MEEAMAGADIRVLAKKYGLDNPRGYHRLRYYGLIPPRLPSRNLERDREIVAKVEEGKTYAAVGAEYGFSKQRVSQIVKRLGRTRGLLGGLV